MSESDQPEQGKLGETPFSVCEYVFYIFHEQRTFVKSLIVKFYILVISYVIASLTLSAQEIFYENINYESGIPSENVYDIYKDSKGYIWCTTDNGIFRYNGNAFTRFKNETGLSLAGSYIREDQLGRIWFESFDGFFFYVENNQLHPVAVPENSGFKPYVIGGNELFFASDRGIERLNLHSLKSSLLIPGKNYLYCHLLGDWLYFGNKYIYRYNLKTKKREFVLKLNDEFKSLITFSDSAQLAVADRSNPQTQIYLINNQGIQKRSKLSLSATIQNLYFTDQGIWIFTRDGIFRYDQQLKPLKSFQLLSGSNVSSLTKDQNGFLWIGSPSGGIYIINNLHSREYALNGDEFSSISTRGNFIYTGTNSGKIYQHSTNLKTSLFFDTHENNPVLYLNFSDYKNWLFFTGNGFYARELSTQKDYRNYFSVKELTPVNKTTAGIAATGIAGIFTINSIFNDSFEHNTVLDNLRAKSCTYDLENNTLYVAGNKGLILMNKNNQITVLKNKSQEIYASKLLFFNHKLYGITTSGSLFTYKSNHFTFLSGNFKRIHQFNGKIYVSDQNAIYLATNNQIKKIKSIGNFYTIIDFQIFQRYLYIITTKKLIKIPLNDSQIFKELPKIDLQSLWFGQQELPIEKYNQVPHYKNSVRIEVNSINFDYLNAYKFEYFVNGNSFQFDEKNNTVILPELSPDHYNVYFRIIDLNSGNEVFHSKTIHFRIIPPFWQRGWFMLLLASIILTSIYLLYKHQIKKIEQNNKRKVNQLTLENNLKESRLQLIKSQMNPHFFFNAINNIQSYIFTNETKEASLYLSKFSRLTRKILEFSDRDTISLQEEKESLQLYLELQQMRFSDLHFEINFHEIQNPDKLFIPTMLFQPYVENAILHGLSHSLHEKLLTVDFSLCRENHLKCVIADNGIGRTKSAEINSKNSNKPASFATKANLERIQILNKDQYKISVQYTDKYSQDGMASGTVVTIQIELQWNSK